MGCCIGHDGPARLRHWGFEAIVVRTTMIVIQAAVEYYQCREVASFGVSGLDGSRLPVVIFGA